MIFHLNPSNQGQPGPRSAAHIKAYFLLFLLESFTTRSAIAMQWIHFPTLKHSYMIDFIHLICIFKNWGLFSNSPDFSVVGPIWTVSEKVIYIYVRSIKLISNNVHSLRLWYVHNSELYLIYTDNRHTCLLFQNSPVLKNNFWRQGAIIGTLWYGGVILNSVNIIEYIKVNLLYVINAS